MIQPRPVPDDFTTIAPTMAISKLVDRYQTGQNVVRRWIAETGVQPAKRPKSIPPMRPKIPAPADFCEVAPTMMVAEMVRHYGRYERVIKRWLKEAGISAKPREPRTPPRKIRVTGGMRLTVPGQNISNIRTQSIYDEAAGVIQRERFAVYRCDERGRADFKGAFWRVGTAVLTPAELLERAERYRRRAA